MYQITNIKKKNISFSFNPLFVTKLLFCLLCFSFNLFDEMLRLGFVFQYFVLTKKWNKKGRYREFVLIYFILFYYPV